MKAKHRNKFLAHHVLSSYADTQLESFGQMKAGWFHPLNCGHVQTVNQPLLVVIQDSN